MISPHSISNMDQLVRKMIFNCESEISEPTNIGDHTITYGYGYTFIRKGKFGWSRYGNLQSDLAQIGITLNGAELDRLRSISSALNNNNLTLADSLITQFQSAWRYPDLTVAQAETLYNREIGRTKDEILARFKNVLG